MQNSPTALRSSLLVALLCLGTLHAQVQSQPDTPDPASITTDHLSGVVVNSLDGKPVARVLVTSPDRRMAAITDSEGRFSFDFRRIAATQGSSSLPPGAMPTAANITVQFLVRKPGYITDNIALPLPTTTSATPEPALQLKIVPAAVLTGHLYPDSGDLPANASVQLLHKNIFNGTANWSFNVARVDSQGEFRFSNLTPGDYKLVAPAHVTEGNSRDPQPDSVPGFRATYYPNADTQDSAATLHLTPGETVTANLAYRAAMFYNVTIPVAGLSDSKGFDATLLPDVPGLRLSRDPKKQAAQGYLPNGDFNLQLRSQDMMGTPPLQNPLASIASIHLQVTGKPIRTEPIAFHPTLELPVVIRRDFTDPNSHPNQNDPQHPNPLVWVGIQSLAPGALQPNSQNLHGDFVIQNLSEGLFRVEAASAIGGYVASVTSGTTDLLRYPLQVLPGSVPRPIEVVLRDDPASLTATLKIDPTQQPVAPEQPAFVLCIPLDRPQAQPLNFFAQQIQFPMPNLPPGRYLILASHQQIFQSLEYRNEDVLRDLITKGATITLSPNQKADIEVPLMPDGAN